MKTDKVLLVTTDAAPYMHHAMSKLTEVFPKMIHVNCLARDLQRISEYVRMNSADVEELICRVASVFNETPSHRHRFREMNSIVPFPPVTTQFTQWNTWIEAAIYYANHFNVVKAVVDCLNEDDSDGIKRAQNAFLSPTVKANLAFIRANFNCFVNAINEINDQHGKKGILLARSIYLIDQVYEPIATMKFPTFRNEFNRLLENNPGYEKLKSINLILNRQLLDSDQFDAYQPAEIAMYATVSITLCNVERTFSAYKSILSENDVPLDQLKEYLIAYCNDA